MNEYFRQYPKKKGSKNDFDIDSNISNPSGIPKYRKSKKEKGLLETPKTDTIDTAIVASSFPDSDPDVDTSGVFNPFASPKTPTVPDTTIPTSIPDVATSHPDGYVLDDKEQHRIANAVEASSKQENEEDLDEDFPRYRRDIESRIERTQNAYQKDISSTSVPDIPVLTDIIDLQEKNIPVPEVPTTPVTSPLIAPKSPKSTLHDPSRGIYEDSRTWKLEPLEEKEEIKEKSSRGVYEDSKTWKLEPMEKSEPKPSTLDEPELPSPEIHPAPADIEPEIPVLTDIIDIPKPESELKEEPELKVEEVPAKEITEAPIEAYVETPEKKKERTPLAPDVADTLEAYFSFNEKTLSEVPHFDILTPSQQRLVVERFASMIHEDTEKRTNTLHARIGKLKRPLRRSGVVAEKEKELREKWKNNPRHNTEKIRLLTLLTKGIHEENSFGVDADGHVDFTEGNDMLAEVSEKLNELIQQKTEVGEESAQKRLLEIDEAIEAGIEAIRATYPEDLESHPEKETEFKEFVTKWVFRVRREVTIGTFMEKHRSLAETLSGTFDIPEEEDNSLAAAGLAKYGKFGGICGSIADTLVSSFNWIRKGSEESDEELLARMGEETPSKTTEESLAEATKKIDKRTPVAYKINHLTSLRESVQKRLDDAKKAKKTNHISVLTKRVAEYNKQINDLLPKELQVPQNPALAEKSEFNNGRTLTTKLEALTKKYNESQHILAELKNKGASPEEINTAQEAAQKLTGRLNARLDYTQKLLLQRKVDLNAPGTTRVGTSISAHANTLVGLTLAIGAAERRLLENSVERSELTKMRLAQVSDMLRVQEGEASEKAEEEEKEEVKEKKEEKATEKKRVILSGSALKTTFGLAAVVLAGVLAGKAASDHISVDELMAQAKNAITSNDVSHIPVPEKTTSLQEAPKPPLSGAESSKSTPPETTFITDDTEGEDEPEENSTPAASTADETVVGGSGGKQITLEERDGESSQPASTAERRTKMEEALASSPAAQGVTYNPSNYSYATDIFGKAKYNSPTTPRYFQESWARGTEALNVPSKPSVESFFESSSSYEGVLRGHTGNEYLSRNAMDIIRENGGNARDFHRAQMYSDNIALKLRAYRGYLSAGKTTEANRVLTDVHNDMIKLNERFGKIFDDSKLPPLPQ